jgi:hypothetical protein
MAATAKWTEARGYSEVYSSMNQYVDNGTYGAYNNPDDWYTSPHMHTVALAGLKPATEYEYKVAGDDTVHIDLIGSFAGPAVHSYPPGGFIGALGT